MAEYDEVVRIDYERELGTDPKGWYSEYHRRFTPALTVYSPALEGYTLVINPDYVHDCRSCGQLFVPDGRDDCSACGAPRLLPLHRTEAMTLVLGRT